MDRPQNRRRALKADPAAQLALLDLQELDSRADQLRHQRSTLPELTEIASLTTSRAELDGRRRDAQIAVDDLTADQAKVDADVEQVKARRLRDQQRMDQGLISSPKDLERMQGELESLQRRITSLEDDELEVMARLEDAQRDLDGLSEQVTTADEKLAELSTARDSKTKEIDESLQAVTTDRGPAADAIPSDLLALYDRLRSSKGGVAVGALRARQCSGCQLSLDPAELASIRAAAPDEVIRHEECQRILVRTPESGL
ncbi:MAG TPA: C4-type zinc ribbon domain-containing protein [Nocardioides sp.]|nr:C4-type zinc ribbon domain-containing protein [Nocardioides sp.]